MSTKKIIFLIVSGLLLILLIVGIWKLSNSTWKSRSTFTGSLSIWIVGDTTKGYDSLIEWFRAYAPEYKTAQIEFKKFSDYTNYQKILLSTLADGNGPDIFVVNAWGDAILKDKIEPIPSEYVHISDFDKRFEDVFLPLLESTGSDKTIQTFIRWVPLGYETLGIFYNKSLLINVPKTWTEVSASYTDGNSPNIFPTNIGMSPRYTPNAIDILSLFLIQAWVDTYRSLQQGSNAFDTYGSYATTPVTRGNTHLNSDDSWSLNQKLWDMEQSMSDEKLTTLDLFIRWKIAFVIGYPSLVGELEDAKKRAGDSAINSIVLTDRVPQNSIKENAINLVRYNYFWLSRSSKNATLWTKFLDYLLTEDAEWKFILSFPLYIPAQRSFYDRAKMTSLSNIFSRTKLDSFIPSIGESLKVFDYGNKIDYEKIFSDNIDRTGKIDNNNIIEVVGKQIGCEMQDPSKSSNTDGCHQ